MHDSTDHLEAKVFRAHAARQGMCDNLIHALERLANQQKDGDSPVRMIVPGLLEKKSAKHNGRAQVVFFAVDKYAAVKIGDVEKETRSKKAAKPDFTTDYPGAVIREGAHELTLRAHEEGVLRTLIDTSNVRSKRWDHR